MKKTLSLKVERTAETIIFDSRWILYPMTIGLIVVLAVYCIKFTSEAYLLITGSFHMEAEQIMVALLGLVDMFMVANLLVMIAQGSYQIFIQKFQNINAATRPQWLDHVDSSISSAERFRQHRTRSMGHHCASHVHSLALHCLSDFPGCNLAAASCQRHKWKRRSTCRTLTRSLHFSMAVLLC